MAFLQAVLIGLIALIVAPGHSFYFDVAPKAVVLLVGTAGLLVLAARRPVSPRGPRLFAVVLLLNAASLALSTAFSSNRALSFYGGAWRSWGAAMECVAMVFAWLVAWNVTGRPDRARVLLRVISIAGLAYGLGDPASLVAWLFMGACLSMMLAQMETGRGWRIWAYGAAAVRAAALIATFVQAHPWAGVSPRLWSESLSMAVRSPLMGYGPEMFLAEFPRCESKALAEANPDSVYESPRNAFLDALVAQGVPGLLLMCSFCAMGLAAAWKLRSGWLVAALVAGIAGMQFTSFRIPTAVLFLTTIALAAGLAEEPGPPRTHAVFAGMAPFLVLALLYLAMRIAVADHSLVETRHLLDAGEWRAATAEYDDYWFWHLPGASADVWYSRSWLEVARNSSENAVREQAIEIAQQAAERSTTNAEEPFLAWLNRAQVAAQREDFQGIESCLRQAIAASPNWYRPHWMLARHLLRESRQDEAATEAALATELAAGHHPELR